MSLKEEIIRLLEGNRDKVLSGEQLAEQLGVSRAAVWKAVNTLRQEGYQVEASTKRGYRLAGDNDQISEQGIRLLLNDQVKQNGLYVLDTVDSTNLYAKRLALAGGQHGDVVLAKQQTAGRGRLGRSFFSPADSGVYMSFLLKLQMPLAEASFFTIAAAVAVCQGVERCTDQKPAIKWVNDIFLDGKKICGILTEAISDFETGLTESIIVGIGVNVKQTEFPDELQKVATALNIAGLQRNQVAASVVNAFFDLVHSFDRAKILEEYKKRLMILGRTVSYQKNGAAFTGEAVDLNGQGNLIVQLPDGTRDVLNAGEISIGSGTVL